MNPGTGDFRRRANVVYRYIRDDQSREISGILLQFLTQHHRRICLVVTMARICRRCHLQRFIDRHADPLQGILQALLQHLGDRHYCQKFRSCRSSEVTEWDLGIAAVVFALNSSRESFFALAAPRLLQLLNSGVQAAGERVALLSKILRISSDDSAFASCSRTVLSFRNLAIAAKYGDEPETDLSAPQITR